jgi:hypothetical protein
MPNQNTQSNEDQEEAGLVEITTVIQNLKEMLETTQSK